jgi:hypothetical protein
MITLEFDLNDLCRDEQRKLNSLKVANMQREEFNCQRRQAQDAHYEPINAE